MALTAEHSPCRTPSAPLLTGEERAHSIEFKWSCTLEVKNELGPPPHGVWHVWQLNLWRTWNGGKSVLARRGDALTAINGLDSALLVIYSLSAGEWRTQKERWACNMPWETFSFLFTLSFPIHSLFTVFTSKLPPPNFTE